MTQATTSAAGETHVGADEERLFIAGALLQHLITETQFAKMLAERVSTQPGALIDCLRAADFISEHDFQEFRASLRSYSQMQGISETLAIERIAKRILPQAVQKFPGSPVGAYFGGAIPNQHRPEPLTTRSRFNVERRLEQGGLGCVYLARDEKLSRLIALKKIRADRGNQPNLKRRFLREARLTAVLEHPNIVPVYDLGDESGDPFYVMRLVGGKTFDKKIREAFAEQEGPPRDRQQLLAFIDVLLDVCDAIAYANHCGVIHRDLKPANIVVGDFGEVIVLDWGLAKRIHAADDEMTESADLPVLENNTAANMDLTSDGEVVGTIAYLSPEQARGDLGRIDAKSDVYGLGAILFAILTGAAPHSRLAARTQHEAMNAIITGPSPTVIDFDPGASPVLNAICGKAMAHNPADRYQSVQQFANDLRAWRGANPVSAYVEPWYSKLARWSDRHSGLARGIGVLILLVLTTFTTVATYNIVEADRRIDFEIANMTDIARQARSAAATSSRFNDKTARYLSRLPSVANYFELRATENGGDAAKSDLAFRALRELLTVYPGYIEAGFVFPDDAGFHFERIRRDVGGSPKVRQVSSRHSWEPRHEFIRRAMALKECGAISSLVEERRLDESIAAKTKAMFYIASPVCGLKSRATIGVVVIGISLGEEDTSNMFRENLPKSMQFYLSDSNGACFLHSNDDPSNAGLIRLQDRFPSLPILNAVDSLAPDETFTDAAHNELVLAVKIPLEEDQTDRYLVLTLALPLEKLHAQNHTLLLSAGFLILLIIALAAAAIIWCLRVFHHTAVGSRY